MDTGKRVKIDPAFFSTSQTRRNKPRATKLKKEFLRKIREHNQLPVRQTQKVTKPSTEKQSGFEDAEQFLSELSQKPPSSKATSIQPSLPPIKIKDAPPWGCLKGSKTPTLRQYRKRLAGNKQSPDSQTPPVMSSQIQSIQPKKSSTLVRLKQEARVPHHAVTVGKTRKSIGILINGRRTRRMLQNKESSLDTARISDIKKFLKEHNLIKTGSTAPDAMLRSLYKGSKMAGNIVNKDGDMLLHNYSAATE